MMTTRDAPPILRPASAARRRHAARLVLRCTTALSTALAVTWVAASCGGGAAPAPRSGADVQAAAETAGAMVPKAVSENAAETAAPEAAAATSAVVADAASAAVTCWYGPSVQRQSDGVERPGAELLVRRTLEPAESRIVEETVRFDPVAGVKPRLYTVVSQVDGDAFSMEDDGGDFSGHGTLSGEPWAWTAWSSVYTLTSGIRVEAEQHLEADGGTAVLVAERVAYGPDGSRALTLHENLARIGDEECTRRFAELTP